MSELKLLESRLSATLTRVADETTVPPFPVVADNSAQRRRTNLAPHVRRRTAVAGIAATVALGGGLSIAAAAGVPVLPGPVLRALGWESTPGGYNADPATARRLLTIAGPEGAPLTLWYSDANDDGYCVSLSSADSAASSGPGVDPALVLRPGEAANGCAGPVGNPRWHRFAGDAYGSASAASEAFIVHVPGAASVRLQFADGASQALPIAEQWTALWLPRDQAVEQPVVVGYAANGTEVGHFNLPDPPAN